MPRIAKVGAAALGTGAVVLSGAGRAAADAGAHAAVSHSPGVASGNVVQVPVHAPINAYGNTADVLGFLNPAVGNRCVNDSHNKHHQGYGS
ncbi:chaplin [Streptomyces incanus]|uniref:Chaplin n=1 Tax=Streptomyces incanus TaxID=887453 RepID=A0ABW0XKQ2_9ACTN